MKVDLTKTWELLLRGKTTKTPPQPLNIIGRKEKLKLLGVTLEQVLVNWDIHIDYLLSKASSRLHIIRICKYHGYSIENLDLLFQSLILSVFTYPIEVWLCSFYSKYLSRIDKLFARCYKLGYCLKQHSILNIRRNRDMRLWRGSLPPTLRWAIFYLPREHGRWELGRTIMFSPMSGQVVLNQFLLIDVFLILNNIF